MQAVQGLINFAPNGENDGGLVLMKGSAKLFNQFFEEYVFLPVVLFGPAQRNIARFPGDLRF